MWLLPQIVVPYHAVEIDRRGSASVTQHLFHLRGASHALGEIMERRVGLLNRRAFGEVDENLELVLVVEWQHLERHITRAGKAIDPSKQHSHEEDQPPRGQSAVQERRQHGLVDAIGEGMSRLNWGVPALAIDPLEHLVTEPRR